MLKEKNDYVGETNVTPLGLNKILYSFN